MRGEQKFVVLERSQERTSFIVLEGTQCDVMRPTVIMVNPGGDLDVKAKNLELKRVADLLCDHEVVVRTIEKLLVQTKARQAQMHLALDVTSLQRVEWSQAGQESFECLEILRHGHVRLTPDENEGIHVAQLCFAVGNERGDRFSKIGEKVYCEDVPGVAEPVEKRERTAEGCRFMLHDRQEVGQWFAESGSDALKHPLDIVRISERRGSQTLVPAVLEISALGKEGKAPVLNGSFALRPHDGMIGQDGALECDSQVGHGALQPGHDRLDGYLESLCNGSRREALVEPQYDDRALLQGEL